MILTLESFRLELGWLALALAAVGLAAGLAALTVVGFVGLAVAGVVGRASRS